MLSDSKTYKEYSNKQILSRLEKILQPSENRIFSLWLKGKSFSEIAMKLDISKIVIEVVVYRCCNQYKKVEEEYGKV